MFMKINEILNPAQIKVEAIRRGTDSGRTMIIADLDKKNPTEHIKRILQTIKDRFIEDGDARIKLLDQNPVIFNVVPEFGKDVYRVSVSFPAGMEHVQRGLITGISNFIDV